MANIAIGQAKYGGKKKNNFRLQEGSNVYRILPPLGELAAEGIWAIYDSLHWGYKGGDGRMKPFKCPQKKNFKTKMVTVQCPECDKIAEKKAMLDDHVKRLEAGGASKEQIAEHVKPLTDWLFSHNLDKKWYLNVASPDGKIGRLAIPHKMYTQLQEIITDLVTKQGVDPIGVEGGVWFDLIRTGKGLQTTHRVTVVEQTEMVNGRPMRVYKPAPLTQEMLNRLGDEAYDLKNAVRTLDFNQISIIVGSNGDPDIVDSAFGGGEITESKAATVAARAAEAEEEPESFVSAMPTANALRAAPVAAAPAPVAAPTAAPAVDPAAAMKAAFEKQMAEMQAEFARKLAAAAQPAAAVPVVITTAPVAQTVTAPAPVAAPAAALSDDDFIKQFGFSK